jgi:hypothetical protein
MWWFFELSLWCIFLSLVGLIALTFWIQIQSESKPLLLSLMDEDRVCDDSLKSKYIVFLGNMSFSDSKYDILRFSRVFSHLFVAFIWLYSLHFWRCGWLSSYISLLLNILNLLGIGESCFMLSSSDRNMIFSIMSWVDDGWGCKAPWSIENIFFLLLNSCIICRNLRDFCCLSLSSLCWIEQWFLQIHRVLDFD